MTLQDRYGRAHTYLRVSVTDRCNYRCTYCMPAEGLDHLPRPQVLTFEEITRIVGVFVKLGIRRVRLTGGEPTIRRGIVDLVGMLGALGLDDLAMTTNGHIFASKAEALQRAGLKRINLSMDTLDADRFSAITRGGDLSRVLDSLRVARELGMTPVKVNCVVVGGENDQDVVPMVQHFSGMTDVHLRFIEYMPFGGEKKHVPVATLRERLSSFGLTEIPPMGGGPSKDWRLDNGLVVGFISPITEHFCASCNRLRLQADGSLRTCLSRDDAPSLRDLMRGGATDAELETAIRAQVWNKVEGHNAHLDEGFQAFEGVMTRIGG